MAQRIERVLIIALLLAVVPAGYAVEGTGTVLASYSFDDEVPTGPDTFRIFQYSKGTVRLTSAYHVSGSTPPTGRGIGRSC